MRITITLFALLIFSNLFGQSPQNVSPDYIQGEVAVRFESGVSVEKFVEEFNESDFDFKIEIKRAVVKNWGIYSISLIPAATNVPAAAEILNLQSGVAHAFPDRIVKPRATTPDDPNFINQWALERINAPEVWDETTGGTNPEGHEIVIAILDSGFDINHQDLVDNIWVNKAENPGDGIDNDGNGLIDDVHGWNFKENKADFTINGHGTSVCGVLGAKGDNGTAISGVNWDVKIMLFEIFSFTSIYDSYYYALEQRRLFRETDGREGAFVVITNGSWGTDGRCEDNIEFDIAYDSLGTEGILSAVATLNSSANIDIIGDIPTSCSSDYLITIANSNEEDVLRETGFGKESIDLSAPGFDISTLGINDSERIEKGTSMSTPFVAGGVALLYSLPCTKLVESSKVNPAETALAIKGFVLNGAEKIASHESKTVSGGRLDLKNSMDLLTDWCRELVGDFEIIKTFPNPVNATLAGDLLKIFYSTPDLETIPYKIFNSIGQLVLEGEIVPDPSVGGIKEIDVANLPPSTYFLSLEKGDKLLVEKFIKI